MKPFTRHKGIVAAMDRSDVDTDQIIPKQFLKRIERTGFGQFLFFDWRYVDGEKPNEQFELNHPANAGATIFVVGRNFGSGSSREHAVWALADYGFKCIIGESFSDIFYNNCFKNGVLPIVLDPQQVKQLFANRAREPKYQLDVDLENQTIEDEHGWSTTFEIDPVRKQTLLQGLDDIDLTLQHEDKITAYEQKRGMKPVDVK